MRGGRGRVLHAGCGQTRAQFRRHTENYSPGSHPGKTLGISGHRDGRSSGRQE